MSLDAPDDNPPVLSRSKRGGYPPPTAKALAHQRSAPMFETIVSDNCSEGATCGASASVISQSLRR